MICCFTGPRAFPWKEESSQHRDVLRQLDAAILQAIELGATHFLCGNAIGVDTWAAEPLIRQKKQHPELFLEIALPFASHNEREFACCAYASWPTGFMWWGTPNAAGRRSISEIGTWWITAPCSSS